MKKAELLHTSAVTGNGHVIFDPSSNLKKPSRVENCSAPVVLSGFKRPKLLWLFIFSFPHSKKKK